jgi:hypothetical protein
MRYFQANRGLGFNVNADQRQGRYADLIVEHAVKHVIKLRTKVALESWFLQSETCAASAAVLHTRNARPT